MPKAKKILLLQEKRETWRVRFVTGRRGFCPACETDTIWLNKSEAARFSSLTGRENFRLTENAQIHFRENDAGILLFCRKSLEKIEEKK